MAFRIDVDSVVFHLDKKSNTDKQHNNTTIQQLAVGFGLRRPAVYIHSGVHWIGSGVISSSS